MTAPASAFPRSVDDLMPDARQVETREGELVPSVRRLMTALKVGADKAKEIRDRLIGEGIRRDVDERVRPLLDSGRQARETAPDESTELPEWPTFDPTPSGERPTNGHRPDAGATELPADVVAQLAPLPAEPAVDAPTQPRVDVDTDATDKPARLKPVVVWPIVLMLLPAFVSVWGGWVSLGEMTGYGQVNLLPGFTDRDGGPLLSLNTAITLPIGMETYAAYALYVWLSGRVPAAARKFAMWSAITALVVGAAGQVAYHLLVEAGKTSAPTWVTTIVSCIPVAVLGMGAALVHLVRHGGEGR